MNDSNTKSKDEKQSKQETPANDNSYPRKNLINIHSNVAVHPAQKLHAFIDDSTSNRTIADADKAEMTLAF